MEAAQTGAIVVYEDHNQRSGLGSLVAGMLMEAGVMCQFRRMGIKRYGSSGSPGELYAEQGLEVGDVVEAVLVITGKAENGR